MQCLADCATRPTSPVREREHRRPGRDYRVVRGPVEPIDTCRTRAGAMWPAEAPAGRLRTPRGVESARPTHTPDRAIRGRESQRLDDTAHIAR